jgi:hypothetical protein
MVDAQIQSTVETARPGLRPRPMYGPALGLFALGAFIGSWFSPWVRSIGVAGFSTASLGDIQYVFSHVEYAPVTGPFVVWVLLFALFLLGVASLWGRTRLVVAAGAIASLAVAAVLVVTAGRVGPDAHATIVFMPADPLAWQSRLQPSGWLAIGAAALLLLLTFVHLVSRPWARSTTSNHYQ